MTQKLRNKSQNSVEITEFLVNRVAYKQKDKKSTKYIQSLKN